MLNIYYKYGITFCLDIIIGVYRSYMILHRLSILTTFVVVYIKIFYIIVSNCMCAVISNNNPHIQKKKVRYLKVQHQQQTHH